MGRRKRIVIANTTDEEKEFAFPANKSNINELMEQPCENDLMVLSKSNFLIGSKYKASLLELRITFLAMLMLQRRRYTEQDDGYTVTMTAAEIKKMANIKSGSIYKQLDPVAQSMTARSIGFSDPQSNSFSYIALITKAEYNNGVFTVKFNQDLKKYLVNLTAAFTPLELQVSMSWSSAYSYRMYELLKKVAYYPKGYTGPRNGLFRAEMQLNELKLTIGVVNSELESVRKILSGNTPDYDKAVAASPERMYERWDRFSVLLSSAINEINENPLSDIKAEFKPLRGGRGGKVYAVEFYIKTREYFKHKNTQEPLPVSVDKSTGEIKTDITEEDRFIIMTNLMGLFSSYKLPYLDVKAIAEAANWDEEVIKKAYDLLQISGNINNITGWMIAAIKNNYSEHMKKENTKTWNNPTDRQYDFEELEKQFMQE